MILVGPTSVGDTTARFGYGCLKFGIRGEVRSALGDRAEAHILARAR
jgi:hypothetical protein